MKKAFNILLLVSFLFLFIYLVRQEYIIPVVHNRLCLGLSFILLFAGFWISTVSWNVSLRSHGFRHSGTEALISHGLSVFAKYIPGKVWVILGRAGYLSQNNRELKNRTFISFKEQAIYLWAGFLISAIPTVIYYGFRWISLLVLLIIAGLSLFLFVERVHNGITGLTRRLFKKEVEVPLLSIRKSLPMIGAVTAIWVSWTTGFYLFMLAFSGEVTPVMMFAFPLSVSFGLIAIILPAGLGLREGIIVGYLTLAGLDLESATTISFMNRLWFIMGEVFIFLLAVTLRFLRSRRTALHEQ